MVERGGKEMMQDQQYNELRKVYTKEVLANLIKADIRQRVQNLMQVGRWRYLYP